jgi:AP endonuclease-2
MTQEGKVIRLLDVLGANNKPNDKKEPPRLAARFWEEHSGKQTLLQKFFGKNKGADEKADEKTDGQVTTTLSASQPSGAPSQHNTPEVQYQPEVRTAMLSPSESTQPAAPRIPSLSLEPPASSPTQTSSRVTDAPQSLKRTFTIEIPSTQTSSKKPKPSEKKPDKKGKSDRGQAKLSSFFNKPGPSQPSSSSDRMIKASQALGVDEVDEVCLVHGEAPPSSQNEFSGKTNGDEVKQVWNSLLAPVPPPNCLVHGEPAKEFTVNKPGPNKGKKFYICSR